MITVPANESATLVASMRYAARLLLVPFWLVGFVVGLVFLLVVAIFYAVKTGFADARTRYSGGLE